MPMTKISVYWGICLLLLTVFGFSLSREFQNHQRTESVLREIVLKDAAAAERFLAPDSVSLENWNEYLNISALKSSVTNFSETSREMLDSALVTLNFAYGLEKYPTLVRFRESLSALMDWSETTPFLTLFQNDTFSEIYADRRRNDLGVVAAPQIEEILKTNEIEVSNEVRQIAKSEEDSVPSITEAANIRFASVSELFEAESSNMTANMPRYASSHLFASKLSSETALPQVHENKLSLKEKSSSVPGEFEKTIDQTVPGIDSSNSASAEDRIDRLARINSLSDFNKAKTENVIPTVSPVSNSESKTENESEADASKTFFPELPNWHFSLIDRMKKEPAPKAMGTAFSVSELSGKMSGDFSSDSKVLANAWLLTQYDAAEKNDLAAAYGEIKNCAKVVDQLFSKVGAAKSKSWKELLRWNELKLNQPADLVVLNTLYRQLTCGTYGLELRHFVNLREAIARYLAVNNQQIDPEGAEQRFQTGKEQLAKLILMFHKTPDSQVQNALRDMLDWMDLMGQSSELVELTKGLWKNPNVVMRIDGGIFERLGTQEMNRTEETNDRLSGATVRGTSQFKGTLTVNPVANEKKAEISIDLVGTADSQSNAYANSVVVSSTAKSNIKAKKTVFFGDNGFETDTTKIDIQTNSKINNVSDSRNRRVVENAANRRAYSQKASTEQQAKALSSKRLQKQIDEPIDKVLTTVNEKMAEMLYQQLRPRGVDFEDIKTWSGKSGIHAQTRVACREGMSAYAMPEAVKTKSDIYFAIHESAFQEIFVGFLDGVNLNEAARQQFKALSPDWMKELLNSQQNENGNTDWAISFMQNWPITVSLKDGKVNFQIHCEKVLNDGKEYPELDVTIVYDMKVTGGKLVMKRQGEVEILPPDFNPAAGKRLPGSIVGLRRVMAKRLQEAFKPEIIVEEKALISEPNEQNKKFANLHIQPVFVEIKNGWLQAGANIVEKERK